MQDQLQDDDVVSASDVPVIAMEGSLATADTGPSATLVTGQLGDYVAADKKGEGDVTTTADYLTTRFKKNALTKSSAPSSTPDTTDDSVYQITMANQKLDLTGKKLQMNVRRKGAFDGGIMFFAGSASDKSWTMAGWSMLPDEDWTTLVFDPVAAKTQNPDFGPTAVLYLGAIFATGDKGDTTPGTVTFYVDQIVVASAN